MGFFDHLHRKGVSAIKPQGAHIRTIERKPSPPASNTNIKSKSNSSTPISRRPNRSSAATASATALKSAPTSTSTSPSPSRPLKRSSSSRNNLSTRASSANGIHKLALSSAHSRSSSRTDSLPSPRINELKKRAGLSSSSASNKRSYDDFTTIPTTTTTTTTARRGKRPTTYDQPLSSDSSDNDSSDVDMALEMRKRTKMSVSVEPDFGRCIKMSAAFDEDDKKLKNLKFVHAADITTPPEEFDPAFVVDLKANGSAATAATATTARNRRPSSSWTRVSMQYPSAAPRERYTLVVPHDDDGFKPIDDIVRTVEAISENYIPATHSLVFDEPQTGLKRRFRRALAHSSEEEFCETLNDYNKVITQLRKEGVISQQLDITHGLPLSLVERILTQIYARTVSPRVETLKRYENGTDNVYGELLPRFITDIFKQTKLKSGQVFVDLGSGVGNVVLQAALEIGCESWGCEMMSNACDLAELQQREFEARCTLWGIAPGNVHLVRGDFLKQDTIIDVLRRADVVLINNQAFTPQLNDKITNLFLEMKEGVQIVSLKGFVPAGHKITARNFNSPINLLSVKKFEYWSEYVSWTDAGGSYFIATKDSQHLRRFAERMRS